MKIYALWNKKKKAYYSTGHGCEGGVNIVNFGKKDDAKRFIMRINGEHEYIIKGISVGG